MKLDLRILGKTASALLLALAMAGCGSSGETTAEPPMPEPEPVPPTEAEISIDAAQDAAAAAATAAETAAGSAEMAAAAAEEASMNRAAVQTGDSNSTAAAMKARMYADAAAAADEAAAQSAAAAATSDVTAAVTAKVAAEAAQATAEAAVPMAEAYQAMAEADAMSELMIDGKTKSVGESTLTIDTFARVETPAAPDTPNKTGFQSKHSYSSAAKARVPYVYLVGPPVAITPAVTGVASRPINLGVVYDTSDDMARVHLVHSYDSLQRRVRIITGIDGMVSVVGETNPATAALPVSMSKTGIANVPMAALPDYSGNPVDVTLTPVSGVFYRVDTPTTPGATTATVGTIQATAKPVPVYSFTYTTDVVSGTPATPGVSQTVMVALTSTQADTNGVTTYTFAPVTEGLYAPTDSAGLLDRTNQQAQTIYSRVDVPVAKMYEHLHFGVWTDTKDNPFLAGENLIASRGIGFVADAGGGGMTADMPVFGDALYKGNWVAAVQANHVDGEGGISVQDGRAMMDAHFVRNTVTINLTGLASMSGKISGNTFSGDGNATATNTALNAAGGAFTGTVDGAFYGPQGAEVGGVFDYDSLGSVGGAFRGAFGAARETDLDIE